MSSGSSTSSTMDQVKSRLRKLKRSSSATFSKLRRRKSGDRASVGSLSESNSRELFVGVNKRNSTQSLRDASYSRDVSRDDSSLHSSVSQRSSMGIPIGPERRRTLSMPLLEAERRSVESGGTTASDSTFPATPDHSFEAALERRSRKREASEYLLAEDDAEDDEESVSTPTPAVDITVDTEAPLDQQEEDEGDFDPLMFAPGEDIYPYGSYEPASDLLSSPLETIYEVDSRMGSALPSAVSRLDNECGGGDSVASYPEGIEESNLVPAESDINISLENAGATFIEAAVDIKASTEIADNVPSLIRPAYSDLSASESRPGIEESLSEASLYSQNDEIAPPLSSRSLSMHTFGQSSPVVGSDEQVSSSDPVEWQHEVEQLLDEEFSYSRSISPISGIEFFSATQGHSVGAIAAMLVAAERRSPPPTLPSCIREDRGEGCSRAAGECLGSPFFGSGSGLFSTSTPALGITSLSEGEGRSERQFGSSHGSVYHSFRDNDAPSDLARLSPIDLANVSPVGSTAVVPASTLALTRYMPAYVTECFNSIFALARHSISRKLQTSYMAALPPVLRLYTSNRTLFLSPSPFATSSLVDSLSYSWHADDVE